MASSSIATRISQDFSVRYLFFVVCEIGAVYFVVASVWHWIRTSKMV